MRALSRLLNWTSRLGPPARGRDASIAPSNPDFEAFALDRYSPGERREIVKLIARQAVISHGDIAHAISRAERKARLNRQVIAVATAFGFAAMFTLGTLVNRHQPAPAGSVAPAPAASPTPIAGNNRDHWSPGGLDEADREFFAELQIGQGTDAAAPSRPRLRSAHVPGLPVPHVAPLAIAVAAQPAARPTPQAISPRHETVIQLGAFADAGVAKARWQALATQFPSLRPLTQIVSMVAHGGRTLYRLRASGTDAANACSALAGAGASCFVATDAS